MELKIIRTPLAEWENMAITLYLGKPMELPILKELDELVTSWYKLGFYGAFGGYLHDISELWNEASEIGFTVDMGSTKEAALEVLIRGIQGFAKEASMHIETMVIGGEMF